MDVRLLHDTAQKCRSVLAREWKGATGRVPSALVSVPLLKACLGEGGYSRDLTVVDDLSLCDLCMQRLDTIQAVVPTSVWLAHVERIGQFSSSPSCLRL